MIQSFQIILEKIRKSNRRMIAAVMVLISASILGVLFYSQKDTLLAQKWELHWEYIIASFFIYPFALAIVTLVWAGIMNTIGKSLPLLEHTRYYILSNLAKRIPGTLWYIAGRSYLYQKEGIPVALVTVASSVEFGITLISGILVSIGFAFPMLIANETRGILVVAGALACIALVQPGTVHWLLRKLHVEQQAEIRYTMLLGWVAAYLVVWILGGLIVYILSMAINPLPIENLPVIIGSWSLAGVISSAFFFFPSNLGITEVSLSLLLSRVMPAPTAVLVAILTRVVVTLFEVIWVMVSLLSLRVNKYQVKPRNSLH